MEITDFLPAHPTEHVKRIVIAGPSGSGKTTLADWLGGGGGWGGVVHTDDYLWLEHGERPARVLAVLAELDSWVLEGTEAGRVLRRGLRPDLVVWLGAEHGKTAAKHRRQAAGVWTLFERWQRAQPGLRPARRWGVTVYELWRREPRSVHVDRSTLKVLRGE